MFRKFMNRILSLFGLAVVKKKQELSDGEYAREMISTMIDCLPIYVVDDRIGYRIMAISFPPQCMLNSDEPMFRLKFNSDQMIEVLHKTTPDNDYGMDV